MSVYNINGIELPPDDLNYTVVFYYDNSAQTYYSLIRVFKKKKDGSFQYPFVKNWENNTRESALDMNAKHRYPIITNAGLWSIDIKPMGYVIENGKVVHSNPTRFYQLTIDNNGDLSYEVPSNQITSDAMIQNGVVSAVTGFGPVVVDYTFTSEYLDTTVDNYNAPGQRNIIGQYENGDYAIITSEGRNFYNSVGFTMPEVGRICEEHNLKFAYILDGGGSTETVLDRKQLNYIYENETGRPVVNYICFNGTSSFR